MDCPSPHFQTRLKDLRARLAASAFANEATAEAFALVREATRRQLGLAHYDTQLIAGKIMLGNQLAEMATGEGKTLTAALAAATAAFAGMPVHLITANDYLVTRDAELLAPVYRALGLSVGTVTRPMDMAQRRLGYALRYHLLHCQGAGIRLSARPAGASHRAERPARARAPGGCGDLACSRACCCAGCGWR